MLRRTQIVVAMLLGLLLARVGVLAAAEDFRSLDEKAQSLKEQVLQLNKDLFVLEEELLFPATTQVAVFLSMDVGQLFQLDSVQLKIDDKVVTHYLYTEREVAALFRGGVQRLYTGNLRIGRHELVAVFTGKGPQGRDYRRGATLVFDKQVDAKLIDLKIMDDAGKQQPQFIARPWE